MIYPAQPSDIFYTSSSIFGKKNTLDPWVIATLSHGYKLQFRRRAPYFNGVKITTAKYPNDAMMLAQQITELLGKEAIEPVEWSARLSGFYSIYYIIPKKVGDAGPILDLRELNQFLKVLPFHMLRTLDVL